MNLYDLMKFFLENTLYVFLGVFIGYLSLIAVFGRYEYWKEETWKSIYELLCIPIDSTKLYVCQKNSNDQIRVIPIDDMNTNVGFASAKYAARIYNIGLKHIKLLYPSLATALRLFIAIVLIAMVSTLPAAWDAQYKPLTFNASVLITTVIIALTGLQFILLNSLKGAVNKDEEDIEVPIEKLLYANRTMETVPDLSFELCRSNYYRSIIESTSGGAEYKTKDDLYLFVSIKSKLFSNEFFKYIFTNHYEFFSKLVIVLVDKPYIENLKVDYQGEKLEDKLDNLEKVKQEKINCIENAKNAVCNDTNTYISYDTVQWKELEKQVDEKIRQEINNALRNEDGKFRRDAMAEISNIIKKPYSELQNYLGFYNVELPVLIHVYYVRRDVVDIYPAHNTPLIWNIERGTYIKEMPYITRIAAEHPMRYIRIEALH